ncbi:hypothetical protein SAMN05421541_106227 [Actinoplanes philippinensis]|uniref:Uncharacterized protein n=2 Tax=Actinoplanes philippinensis TaxID=35752 RepID=A0A1I2G791_9ACTN|nr:hypothetical protein SAMN05421541_106227 [Actinoplanes philippinensis]
MAAWQMECCGTSFREGDKVSWRLRHPHSAELAWLDTVLHDGAAATVNAIEDHHGDPDAPLTEGTVISIATLHCRFEPEPVAGSGLVTAVVTAEKWNDDLDERHLAGFLIRILALDSAGSQDGFSINALSSARVRSAIRHPLSVRRSPNV